MPRRYIWIATSVVIALANAPAGRAQDPRTPGYVNGDRLIYRCISDDHADDGLCLGYILGVIDAMQAAQASGGALLFGWRARPSPDATAQRLRDAVVRFLMAHPQTRLSSASGLVAKALSDAFPCG
jgi:hypothetical protein